MRKIINIEGVIGKETLRIKSEKNVIVSTVNGLCNAASDLTNRDRLEVHIRSTGGNQLEALEMYYLLKSLPCHVDTYGYGYIASAAVTILQAGRTRYISPNALMLVHNCNVEFEGNSRDIFEMMVNLSRQDGVISGIYADRSCRSHKTFLELMDENNGNGRWLNVEEMFEYGLVDEEIEKEYKYDNQEVQNCC